MGVSSKKELLTPVSAQIHLKLLYTKRKQLYFLKHRVIRAVQQAYPKAAEQAALERRARGSPERQRCPPQGKAPQATQGEQ